MIHSPFQRVWRLAVAFAVVAMVVGFQVANAGDGEPAVQPSTCGPKSAVQIAAELERIARNGIADCPEFRTSEPNLTPSGPSTLTDTGLARCRVREDNLVVECPLGLTIHIETKACRCGRCESGQRQGCDGSAIVGVACRVHYL